MGAMPFPSLDKRIAGMARSYSTELLAKPCRRSHWQIPLGTITGYHAIIIARRGDAG